MIRLSLRATVLCLFTAFATGLAAFTQSNVSDVVSVRPSKGDSELNAQGYGHIDTQKHGGVAYSQWRNPSLKSCLSVQPRDSRFQTIKTAPSTDCSQNPHHYKDDSNDDAAAAALAIGAVAALHKPHHHDGNSHYSDRNQDEEFERGCNDGKYHPRHSKLSNTDAYGRDYDAGVQQRDHDPSYRQHSARHDSGFRGEHDYEFTSLAGERREPANDRVVAMNDIRQHPACR
jgi:hypothetical protein